MKKIFILLLFLYSLSFASNKYYLLRYESNNPKQISVILNLEKQFQQKMSWLNSLPEKEQTGVLFVYRTIFEKIAQKITKKMMYNSDKSPLAKYSRIIGVSDVLLLPYVKNPFFKKIFKDEIRSFVRYISGKTEELAFSSELETLNLSKLKLFKEIGPKQFEKNKVKYINNIKESLPLFFKIIIYTELNIVNDKDLEKYLNYF